MDQRQLYKLVGDREFGKWCNTNFPNLSEHVSAKEVTAILWAAKTDVSNDTSTPSQEEHADALGVSRNFPNLRNTVSKSCLMKTSVNGALATSQT